MARNEVEKLIIYICFAATSLNFSLFWTLSIGQMKMHVDLSFIVSEFLWNPNRFFSIQRNHSHQSFSTISRANLNYCVYCKRGIGFWKVNAPIANRRNLCSYQNETELNIDIRKSWTQMFPWLESIKMELYRFVRKQCMCYRFENIK